MFLICYLQKGIRPYGYMEGNLNSLQLIFNGVDFENKLEIG